jgi:hypothetical protein
VTACRAHATLTIVWIVLTLPTLLLWRESITWLALMSVYAIVATHWDAYQSAKAERDG